MKIESVQFPGRGVQLTIEISQAEMQQMAIARHGQPGAVDQAEFEEAVLNFLGLQRANYRTWNNINSGLDAEILRDAFEKAFRSDWQQRDRGFGFGSTSNTTSAKPMQSRPWASVLGVFDNADPEHVKKQYRELTHKHHPDKPGGDHATMAKINAAYDQFKTERGIA